MLEPAATLRNTTDEGPKTKMLWPQVDDNKIMVLRLLA